VPSNESLLGSPKRGENAKPTADLALWWLVIGLVESSSVTHTDPTHTAAPFPLLARSRCGTRPSIRNAPYLTPAPLDYRLMLPLRKRKSGRRKKRGAWQQVSLVAGLLAGKHFLGVRELHYGYWDGLDPVLKNLPLAQENYSQFLLQHIPADARRILDVGSGAGGLAFKLLARGHQVDCVCPSQFLNDQARDLVDDRARIFQCKYEDFSTTETYDAIVFCESFQYVDMEKGLRNAVAQLRSGGSLVICDFFRTALSKGPISGGHKLVEFQTLITQFPLKLVEDIDITPQTAPSFTVIDQIFGDVLQPIWHEVNQAFTTNRPWTAKLVRWLFRKKINKFEGKYFTHERSAENFQKFKTYRLLRFERD
jgi:MPBQ/MSBQ methyltransferase